MVNLALPPVVGLKFCFVFGQAKMKVRIHQRLINKKNIMIIISFCLILKFKLFIVHNFMK